ncbi:MAG: hypothetical protein ABI472_19730 [Ginsengibacter sp.]
MNYFELFEIPVSLSVDTHELQAKYAELRKKYDSEIFKNEEDNTRKEMAEKNEMVTNGYRLLQDPDDTIQYVLEMRCLYNEEESYDLPAAFLTEMAELNEALTDEDILDIEEAETKIFSLQKTLYDEVQNIFEGYSDDTTTDAQLLQVKDYYYKKKFLKRILERLDGMRNIASPN